MSEITQVAGVEVNIGIAEDQRQAIAERLSRLLADTYTLYLKTHNFHWNVTGPMFNTLHLMFEQQYNELALAVDQIAERIRSLGFHAPRNYAAYSNLSSVPETEDTPTAEAMIKQLARVRKSWCVRRARFSPPPKPPATSRPPIC